MKLPLATLVKCARLCSAVDKQKYVLEEWGVKPSSFLSHSSTTALTRYWKEHSRKKFRVGSVMQRGETTSIIGQRVVGVLEMW